MKQILKDLLDVGSCEKEDITCAMKDTAEFSTSWIHDSILRRYIRKTGDKRLSVDTRKLIKAKSYDNPCSVMLLEEYRSLVIEDKFRG